MNRPAERDANGAKRGGRRTLGERAELVPNLPLVTVITATFNASDCILKCMESVRQQDYPNLEHIVIDGGSTDSTLEILRYSGKSLDLWVSEPDKGVYDAWNKGLDLARGEWIAFLGADDVYLPGAVFAYIELARKNPDARFLSSRARLDHPSGYSPVFGGPWKWPEFAKAMTTVHVGSMHHRSMFDSYSRFDSSYRIAGDYEFMLRAGEELKAAFTPQVTVVMRAGGVSDSTAGLHEAFRAKTATGVRGTTEARADLRAAILRFRMRRVYLRARALLGRRQKKKS